MIFVNRIVYYIKRLVQKMGIMLINHLLKLLKKYLKNKKLWKKKINNQNQNKNNKKQIIVVINI